MTNKGHVCGVCGQDKSSYIMNNKRVCLKCDELLFDLEIECEEIEKQPALDRSGAVLRKPAPAVKK
jgi:hypothetical protein